MGSVAQIKSGPGVGFKLDHRCPTAICQPWSEAVESSDKFESQISASHLIKAVP